MRRRPRQLTVISARAGASAPWALVAGFGSSTALEVRSGGTSTLAEERGFATGDVRYSGGKGATETAARTTPMAVSSQPEALPAMATAAPPSATDRKSTRLN